MKLLVDMNLSPRWVAALETLGIPAVHWSQLGPTNAPDEALMAYAAENDWVVLTNDLDFGAILAASAGRSPSVIQNLETAVGHARVGCHGVRWQGATTTRAYRPLGAATRPACARAAQSGV